MEIHEIKARLSILTVLQHYNLTPDKNKRICCPFHNDKTPSMQVYPETGTVYCFSSNCQTHGKSIDQIDFILHKENCSKHEAIEKAKSLLGYVPDTKPQKAAAPKPIASPSILEETFSYFRSGFTSRKDNKAKTYLEGRGLDIEKLESLGMEIGYNSGQFHHRGRLSEEKMQACEHAGLLIKNESGGFRAWGNGCAVFPLKDKNGNITGMYGRASTSSATHTNKHFYLKNSKGLFHRPKPGTAKLIITESIIDFLSLYQLDEIRNGFEIMPIYGTNRLTSEHKEAIKELKGLKEVIFFLDGDEAGEAAVKKYSEELRILNQNLTISKVQTPKGEDINSLLQGHETDIFTHLLKKRTELFLSTEKPIEIKSEAVQMQHVAPPSPSKSEKPQQPQSPLDTTNPNNISYTGTTATYYIKGFKLNQPDSLKVSLHIVHPSNGEGFRTKLDLYEHKQTTATANGAAEKLELRSDLLEKDLSRLTDLLEDYRDRKLANGESAESEDAKPTISESTVKKCTDFLKHPKLLKELDKLVKTAGVVREEKNRVFLTVIASSYFMPETLHAIVQGGMGSSKTHLVKQVSSFMPPEDVIRLTRVTDSSFYNYGEYQLKNKLIVIEDYDGLREEAEYAFRELQSNGEIISSTSAKDETSGTIYAKIKRVRGPICSMVATTKGEIYEDNMSRCFILAVDESKEQDMYIVKYQNDKAAGLIDKEKEAKAIRFLQDCFRVLKPHEVVNPFATKILLPERAARIRRLNQNFQNFVKQVTVLNQYQRARDKNGRLITEKSDIQTAIEIMFDSIVLKVDELDGSLRNFYERLKTYVLEKGKDYEFTRREIRQALAISKTQQHAHFKSLEELEYITQSNGYANRGFKYKISYWDSIEKIRAEIKDYLNQQLEKL